MPDPDAPSAPAPPTSGTPQLRLDGFEGPLHLLLALAREQQVDLARVSVLALVDQFLAALERLGPGQIERAAEWLVMAAWLTWLKSRLLLPRSEAEAEEAERAAEHLQANLAEFARMKTAAAWLTARPQLGRDVFARGLPEPDAGAPHAGARPRQLRADLAALARAYASVRARRTPTLAPRAPRPALWRVHDALRRIAALLDAMPDASALERFLPDVPREGPAFDLRCRAAVAGTLVAALELTRGGSLRLEQDEGFGPVLVRRAEPAAPDGTRAEANR